MRKSWQIFTRDAKRLFRVRKAWVIVIGMLITPALYAWLNINAFWDPYSNTANIDVAVANLDRGAESDLTGAVNIGDQVVDQLQQDEQLGWKFMSEEEAHESVERGEVYAAIVIPAEFSEDLLSLTSGEFTQPALQYFVNEKASAIAPKITDVGASELDKQITNQFKEQVAHAASEAVKDAGDSVELRLLNARGKSLDVFDRTAQTLMDARSGVEELLEGIDSSRTALASARTTLGDVDDALGDVRAAVGDAQAIVAETQQQLVELTDTVVSAYATGTALLADASASAHASITQLTQRLDQAGARIDASIEDVSAVLAANETSIAELQALIDDASLDPALKDRLTAAVAELQQQNAQHQELLAQLQQLGSSAADAVQSVQAAADALDGAAQDAKGAAAGMREALTTTVPAMNSAMSRLLASAASFSSAIGAQQTVLSQADALLVGIDGQLLSTAATLQSFDEDLAGLVSEVQQARTDVVALGAASDWGALRALTGLDPDRIAQFVSSPVTVDEHVVYPVSSYGSAMAALFTNLSLWIGAFVLVVIFKTEVDTEGLEEVTVRQAYFGRFFLFAVLAALQALVVCVGDLLIGVQTVSALAFVATGVFIALVYASIVYALSVAFGHIGRGLCVLLVIMQIPGASGMYPIELMPAFFRALYPLLPFSYGIDALRETIAGFYGNHYWGFLGALALMMALAFLLGPMLRRRFSNFNLLFNRQIASTDLLIGEKVQVVGAGYRLSDVVHALQHRDEYREELARRAEPFTQRYPTLLRGTLLIGVTGMVVLAVVAWVLPGGKALLLGLWVLWCLLVMGALVVLEYVKQSFERAGEVGEMDESELHDAVLAEGAGLHTEPAPAGTAGNVAGGERA